MFIHAQIPSATVTFYGYGLPRVGNQEFANYVDANLNSFTRITNLKDPVPIIPGRGLGFHHPSSEAHIDNDPNLSWKNCPGEFLNILLELRELTVASITGQDNTDDQCSIGDTPNLFVSDAGDHSGECDCTSLL